MTEGFKRLNQTIEKLEKEKEKMTQHIHFLQEKIKTLHFSTNQIMPLQIKDHPEGSNSSPSHFKMDKMGVHFLKNVEKATVSAKGTTSPVQTVAGKDLSNSLMADTLPKSVRLLPTSFNITRTIEQGKRTKGFLLKRKRDKRIEQMTQNSLHK